MKRINLPSLSVAAERHFALCPVVTGDPESWTGGLHSQSPGLEERTPNSAQITSHTSTQT